MPKNNYDLDNLEACIGKVRSNPTNSNVYAIKNELNRFIPEAKCIDIIYTKNTDKLFFGIKVLAILDQDQVSDVLLTNEIVKIKNYYVEIDSKIFDMGFTTKELTAMLLHEIGHIVIGGNNIAGLRKAIDAYFTNNKSSLSIKDTAQYKQLLVYGMQDTLIKLNSFFYKTDPEEVAADTFVHMCGYGPQLESAFKKIYAKQMGINAGVPKLAVMNWALAVYKEMKFKRIPALHLLNRSKVLTGSTLEKREIDNVIRALQRIDTDVLGEATIFIQEAKSKNSLFSQLKYGGLKTIENDVYEFQIRAKNAETEDDVFYALRQINTRISLLEDYLNTEEISEHETEKWYKILTRYRDIREQLASKKIYNKKQYGIWFDYNQLNTN